MPVSRLKAAFMAMCNAVNERDGVLRQRAQTELSQLGVAVRDANLGAIRRSVSDDARQAFWKLHECLEAGNERAARRCLHVLKTRHGFSVSVDFERFRESGAAAPVSV